ncbi:MAG: hypothetical protein HKM04_05670 [Legionellales bacterium]|nr:hypothetical protein [Legionellales bacterium]
MIDPSYLKIGDILLLKDKSQHFFRHVVVVTQVDIEQNIYKIMHFRRLGEPSGLVEATLSSSELLNQRNLEYECYRLKDQEQAIKAIQILRQWFTWAVPFDTDRFKRAELSCNNFFAVSSNLMNHIPPQLSEENYPEKIKLHRQEMETLFNQHYMDIIKYAARRDISPVRPKFANEKQTGFHCLQGILLAFQVSYAQDFVNSVTDKWLANKHVVTNENLSSEEPRFEMASTALKANFNKEAFLAAFPLAFRLWAKLSSINTFEHAMLSDKEKITYLGTLNPLQEADIKPDAETMAQSCRFFKAQGDSKRVELLHQVVSPSGIDLNI